MAQSKIPKSDTKDFSDFEQDIIQGLLSGKPLAGKDGVLAGLIGYVTEKVMDAELSEHLQRQAEEIDASPGGGSKNKRNGKAPKTLNTEFGQVHISPPLTHLWITR